MKSKTIGILLAAVGVGLIWHFRKRRGGHGMGALVKRVPITLKMRPDGRCGIKPVPDVTLCPGEPMQWEISNPEGACPGTIEVCIKKWTKGGMPSEPPVNSDGSCRSVKAGHPPKILPARAKPAVPPGDYYYEIWLDGALALDPIVRIVL